MERWIRSLPVGILLAVLLFGTLPMEAAAEAIPPGSMSEDMVGETALEYGKEDRMAGEVISEYGQEDYTDTDTRRGILAVRMEAFEGFHGTAELTVCGKESGREWQILLKQEAFYQANQELPIGEYRISGILAVSEGRAFDCLAEPVEFSLTEGKTAFCRVSVFSGSVYRIPYEEDEMGGLEPEIGESRNGEGKLENANREEQKEQNLAEADDGESKDAARENAEWENTRTGNEKAEREEDGHLENEKTNGGGSINALEETGENGDSEVDRNSEADGDSPENGIPAAFAVGLAGFMGCAGWIFRLLTKKREGGV